MGLRTGDHARSLAPRAAALAAALCVLGLAACGGGSAPGAGVSPRPSLSLPAPSGTPGAGRPQPTAPAETAPAEPTAAPTRPATAPPATEPPATAPPATAPPATAPPATAPPATAPVATAPPATAAPSSTSGSISPWWWLLVAAIVVGLAVGGVLLWRRRSARRSWSEQLGQVTTELRWANDQLIPGMLAAHTAGEFRQSWSDGRPRLVAADQQLYALARSAPEETRAASIGELRTAMAGLMSAVDGEAGLTSTDPDALRAARADVERARSGFTAALDAAEGKPQPATPEPVGRT